jgi:alpha-amylase
LFVYYGEEIGMVGTKPDPDIRRPMQWNADANAGFSTGKPSENLDPGFQVVNVAAESGDSAALLSFYKTIIAIRSENPVLRSGGLNIMSTGNSGVYAVLRSENNSELLVIANLTDKPVSTYELSGLTPNVADGKYSPIAIYGLGSFVDVIVANGNIDRYQPISSIPAIGKYLLEINP